MRTTPNRAGIVDEPRPTTEWHARLTESEIYALLAAKLTASAWSVYVTLRLHADAKGIAFPSVGSLTEKIGIERRNVQIAIDLLVAKRLIKVETRLSKNGAQKTNIYTFLHVAVEATREGVADNAGGASYTTRGGVVHDAGGASYTTPKQTHLTDQRTDALFESESRARASPQQQPSQNQVELLLPIAGGASASASQRSPTARASPQQPSGHRDECRGELLTPIDGGVSAAAHHHHNGGTRNDGKTRIPVDWQPSAENREYAAERGYGERWINAQAELFRDHYRAKGEWRADWSATWRAWVQRDPQFAGSQGARAGAGSRDTGLAAVVSELMSDAQMAAG